MKYLGRKTNFELYSCVSWPEQYCNIYIELNMMRIKLD